MNKKNIFGIFIFLLINSISLHATNPDLYYPNWIRNGDTQMVRDFITEYPTYINRFSLLASTPLKYAIDNGQYEIAKLLIQHGADATEELERAIINTKVETLTKIIDADPKIVMKKIDDSSLIGFALKTGGSNPEIPKILHLLLDKGVPVSNQEITMLDQQIGEIQHKLSMAEKGYRKERIPFFRRALERAEELKLRIEQIQLERYQKEAQRILELHKAQPSPESLEYLQSIKR
jgi:ankyrin repeat protein